MTIKYRELKRRFELDGAEKTTAHLCEALRERHIRPEELSLRDLAETLIPDGPHWVRRLDPRASDGVSLLESGDGSQRHRPGDLLEDHGGLYAGGVCPQPAGGHDSHAARR